MSLTLYADFSTLDSYLAARRADILAAVGAGSPGVPIDFRVVEHCPELPVRGRRLSAADQDALTARFGQLERLLLPGESLPWDMPPITPKTEAAVSAYAAVYGSPVDAEVRRLLFDLYWCEGSDIGDPNVLRTPLAGPVLRAGSDSHPLREIGYVVSVDRAPLTTEAHRRIRAWRAEWHDLGSPELPVLLVGGATLHGIDALRRLGKEISYTGADVAPHLPDPRRYRPERVQPSPFWTSWVGGRWRNSYRLDGPVLHSVHW